MKNVTLRYIPSAYQSAGSFLTVRSYYPDLADDMLKSLSTQEEDIDIGVLYNAFSEKSDAYEFNDVCRPLGIKQYADSGGLQVMSIGAEITPEIKSEIFHTQMDTCDYAMSFDEIPVGSSHTGSGVREMDTRFYIDEYFKKKAIESGQNIVEQIKTFKKDPKTNAQILFIVQCRNFETAREWSWYMFQEIKKEPDYERYIGGLALGNTGAGGLRNVYDFMLRFQTELEFLPLSWRKKLHVLGAGAVSRLLPVLCAADSYFLEGTIITCDSTTQTRGPVFGNFLLYNPDGQTLDSLNPGRGINPQSLKVCDAQAEYVLPFIEKHREKYDLKPVCSDTFREHYTEYADHGLRKKVDFIKLYGETDLAKYEHHKHSRMSRFFWSMTMISSFLKFIESLKIRAHDYRRASPAEQNKIMRSLKNSLPQKLYKPAKLLMALKSHSDYVSKSEFLSGHPYTEVLDVSETSRNDVISGKTNILTHQGLLYTVDFYEDQVVGRVLETFKAGKAELTPDTPRKKILSYLNGTIIDTQKTATVKKDTLDDEW